MPIDEREYYRVRDIFIKNPDRIVTLEKSYMEFLLKTTLDAADDLFNDFASAADLVAFWINYVPKQRGRKPKGTSIPWIEVGEKSLSFNLLKSICKAKPSITFPGIPFGGDVRFATDDAFIHCDIKLTGPNDNPDELVVPPQQVSGDGIRWDGKAINSPFKVIGPRAQMLFQPKLPAFYILNSKVLPCLTYFLKGVYTVEEWGVQPLNYVELICVPNGLLLFDSAHPAAIPGLFIPGKDVKSKALGDKRTRIRLGPLASSTGSWRCMKIKRLEKGWQVVPRCLPGTR